MQVGAKGLLSYKAAIRMQGRGWSVQSYNARLSNSRYDRVYVCMKLFFCVSVATFVHN